MPSDAKLNKPPIFTGKDLSLATVNTWAIRAEDYVDDTPNESRKIKVAGSFLTETAELWYITSIRSRTPMIATFAEFITTFKAHFSRADEPHILRDQLQQMTQGDRNVIDYLAEFETVVAQIGASGDMVWIKSCFERGLDDEIQRKISHTIRPEDTLQDIARAAQRAHECGLRLKPKVTARNVSTSPATSPRRNGPSHRAPSESSPSTRPHPLHSAAAKLSDSQRSEYQNNDQCFHCGKPGHKAKVCYSRLAELAKGKSDSSPAKTYVKRESVNVVEADSESDSSQYSVPTIKIPILVPNSKGKKMLEEALMDCGATVSIIDTETVKEKNLRTEPSPKRYRLRQAFSNKTEVATRMVKEHITIPSKSFTSKKPVPLLVAPLNHSKIILGMPFFKQENIGIQPATRDLIIPTQEEVKPRNESFKSNVRHCYLSNEVSGIRKATPLQQEAVMEVEVQGSSPSNSIDHTGMDSLGSDSDEEHVDGMPHANGISHADGRPHADGTSHVDETSHSHVTPPRTKRTDRPTQQ